MANKINAYWIDSQQAFRLYDPRHPQQTIAYVDSIEEAEESGYKVNLEEPAVTGHYRLSVRVQRWGDEDGNWAELVSMNNGYHYVGMKEGGLLTHDYRVAVRTLYEYGYTREEA